MDGSDFDAFADRLTVLAEHWDRSLSSAQLVMDFEALADLSREHVFAAMTRALQESTFWPSIAELRRFALGDTELRVEQAWMTFRRAMAQAGSYRSVAFVDAALGEAIIAIFDGWPQACATELSPEMWASTRKTFDRIYRLCLTRQSPSPCYLPGSVEHANGERAKWAKYLEIAIVDATDTKFLRGDSAQDYRVKLRGEATLALRDRERPS